MNKNSAIDYFVCILFKILGPFIRVLPLNFSFFLGRRLGDLFYYFDFRHKALAYSNIKAALGKELSPCEITYLTRRFYQAFGQNFIEILLIPLMDKDYLDKHIQTEGLDNIKEGFRRGKGVILLSMHAGSWELSNIICAYLGFPFVLFVREQRFPRLNKLLNTYRLNKSYKIIERENGALDLIRALKDNAAIGMMADQGGRAGTLVEFFGQSAAMPSGAIRFALKYNAAIVPVYYTRVKGPRLKIILGKVFEVRKSGGLETDIRDNLQELIRIYEENIRRYPQEYLWTYKIWKYGRQKKILILSDAKAGHLRQAQAVAKTASTYLKDKGIDTEVTAIEVKFKSNLAKAALILSSCLAGKYHCQGCLWCLRAFLENDAYRSLTAVKPDMIISCGHSAAPINYVLSRENLAKSISLLRPSLLSMRRFDLVIMPRHDNPPKRKNVVVTEGALNLIDEDYLKEEVEKLRVTSYAMPAGRQELRVTDFYIGLLIGGDSKNFRLDKGVVSEIIRQVKLASEKYHADILVTTSRRTSPAIEELVKQEFKDYPRSKLLVIANEKNIPEAVGGILGLSKMVIVSPESISMISEAASSGKYVLVFRAGVGLKHRQFLDDMLRQKYIYLCGANEVVSVVDSLLKDEPKINTLKDRTLIRQALEKII